MRRPNKGNDEQDRIPVDAAGSAPGMGTVAAEWCRGQGSARRADHGKGSAAGLTVIPGEKRMNRHDPMLANRAAALEVSFDGHHYHFREFR